ncbi:FtsX-like permease family protein [Sphaerisporangium corydalis]|uniref:FtsX-like permease family protein n=1 Tax=Sphaerisporangium corydalis TaxID=1441875 RepID=A0ABV9E9I2_9ACTN|nr:FtsX-like permease family protein [Sphaerisporangium corydalis]
MSEKHTDRADMTARRDDVARDGGRRREFPESADAMPGKRRGVSRGADLVLGARLAFAGGRDGWTRTVLTAVGVGIGVALLLLAAAVPGALQARHDRGDARDDTRFSAPPLHAGPGTVLVAQVDTSFRGTPVRGRLVRAEGPKAPVPPGVAALPLPGEVVVSPALRDLLGSPDGRLLAPRLGGARVSGTIGDAGLAGPNELAYYLGSGTLPAGRATRIDAFGGGGSPSSEYGPVLDVLIVIIFVVLLLPIAIFLGAAVRFGGERRDRRLAALRLVGADRRMTRRIAAGEAAVGAVLGLAVGGALFLAGRRLVPLVTLWNLSVFAGDVRPALPLVVVIMLAVPALAVVVSLATLRGVAVEPLGVTRRAVAPRRRLWWRLVLPGAGLALLLPLLGGLRQDGAARIDYQVAAGAVLLLVGAVTLLPWLIELVVGRIHGGPVGWQLAIRRLQLDSATSARLVNGIAVAVAGTIGLQMLFAGAQDLSTSATGHDVSRAQVMVHARPSSGAAPMAGLLRTTPGVAGAAGTLQAQATTKSPSAGEPVYTDLRIGDCASLAEFGTLGRCADGDVFLTRAGDGDAAARDAFRPGTRVSVGDGGPRWALPRGTRTVAAREDASGSIGDAILVTPGAIDAAGLPDLTSVTFVRLDPKDTDAVERVRNTVARADPLASVSTLSATEEATRFTGIRRGLYAGIVVTLLLISASMLVGILEQLREQRRLLAMLVAVGTRRGSLTWSVIWQTVIPVLIGLVLAVVFGLGLGLVLLRVVSMPLSVDWTVVGLSAGIGAAVVLLVTGLSLPALWRLTRPDGLRAE